TLPAITEGATCEDWAAWIPPRSDPAVVMQVVSEAYIDIERNFIRLMERNSALTRHNLFLMCMDDESARFFESSMNIRCVSVSALKLPSHSAIWKLRVKVVSCLVEVGRVDVIMSDADALWLGDPIRELYGSFKAPPPLLSDGGGGGGRGGIHDSDVVASRGSYPKQLGDEWGSTICMGFILLRGGNVAAMKEFLDTMESFVLTIEDDQISINQAAHDLGIVWDKDSDMRYAKSTDLGTGTVISLPADAEGRPFSVTLLPHSKYTRRCGTTPISAETIVAHCLDPTKRANAKTIWMQQQNLWFVQEDP
ncbi:unnamed protein product, partial [Pylaiella littoralis]